MSGRSPESLLTLLHKAPKVLYKVTSGDRKLSAVSRLRVETAKFLDEIVPEEQKEEIDTIAAFLHDSLTFNGISIPSGGGDTIELGTSGSDRFEYGVTLIGSKEQRKGKNWHSHVERQQWLIGYTSRLGLEVWYAGPGVKLFTQINDSKKIAKIEPLLQKLFQSGRELWQASH